MIRRYTESDFDTIYEIINDAAEVYHGVIPEDRWQDPYMSRDELAREIRDGVDFWGDEREGQLIGIMGIQDKGDVTLIRHSYVRSQFQSRGIGTGLLHHLEKMTVKPVLIGTWADASWAINFYQKRGFNLVTEKEKNLLLEKYWSIPKRQVATSVVLVNSKWQRR